MRRKYLWNLHKTASRYRDRYISSIPANRLLIPTSMPVSLLPIGFKGILKAITPDHLLLNLVWYLDIYLESAAQLQILSGPYTSRRTPCTSSLNQLSSTRKLSSPNVVDLVPKLRSQATQGFQPCLSLFVWQQPQHHRSYQGMTPPLSILW
jgi:hypothetical protein